MRDSWKLLGSRRAEERAVRTKKQDRIKKKPGPKNKDRIRKKSGPKPEQDTVRENATF